MHASLFVVDTPRVRTHYAFTPVGVVVHDDTRAKEENTGSSVARRKEIGVAGGKNEKETDEERKE